jgi:hypothetical protein
MLVEGRFNKVPLWFWFWRSLINFISWDRSRDPSAIDGSCENKCECGRNGNELKEVTKSREVNDIMEIDMPSFY